MTKLIVNADDFGYSESANYGILSAHKKGIVTSCTIMANMPGFQHGIELLKKNKSLTCGVHMTLTSYKPLLSTHKTIVDKNGNYFGKPKFQTLESQIDLDEVYKEFCAQIDKVKNYIDITHIDSHHHLHCTNILKSVTEEVAKKYNVPMRVVDEFKIENTKTVECITTFFDKNVEVDYFNKNMSIIKSYDIVDLMCHPAYIDDFMFNMTSYVAPRTREITVLSDLRVKEILEENNIKLTNYRDM